MTTTTPYAPIGALASACSQELLRLHGVPGTASAVLIAPVRPLHATGLSFAGGMPPVSDDDATGLPPRGAPV